MTIATDFYARFNPVPYRYPANDPVLPRLTEAKAKEPYRYTLDSSGKVRKLYHRRFEARYKVEAPVKGLHIHHLDHSHTNDKPDNLRLMVPWVHRIVHESEDTAMLLTFMPGTRWLLSLAPTLPWLRSVVGG